MLLSKENLTKLTTTKAELPSINSFDLPERILQFGTGVLLRGLPDYYVDKANKRGLFNGRVLVVKSTSLSGADAFSRQDGLYTVCIKGLVNGKEVVEYTVNNAISRVLSAAHDWESILEAAENPDLQVVFSNTTEVGIVMSNDSVSDAPPTSFPGKLLAFLYRRYTYFQGDKDRGLVILPTELISDNAQKLKKILLNLAAQNELGSSFVAWLEEANDFCNTLVDRIVPGRLPQQEQEQTEIELGFEDELMIMAEPFSLWAIETDSPRVKAALSFAQVDDGIVLVPSIDKFKEIKLRLLNGTHTLSCAAALWSGFSTVKEAMSNTSFNLFVKGLMQKEIGKAILDQYIEQEDVDRFSNSVIDRFSNPFLDHRWENIALNYTSKMNMRNVALIDKWYKKHVFPPLHIALGFAAYLKFMNTRRVEEKYVQDVNGRTVVLQDEFAPLLFDCWKDEKTVVSRVLSDDSLWGTNLAAYPQFMETVQRFLDEIETIGVLKSIEKLNIEWQVAY
ncbi:tagaturonate reductase [Sphingobacterium allocomposti]|uniref:Tagaturonate reductase n=1 Tax=Sphingobacterium allocomposti TaxID=415956 RepID=A0A5S5D6I3_9SPHI|nr:tagaturonate reductase [Sphingobacterium composti Yoo et al. 2007 non Ten et al. 2007]TYP90259.1 tagaturonate reductase [Sphingobacterium composti Yoo et al. 2007 non Ten et al. 2007]